MDAGPSVINSQEASCGALAAALVADAAHISFSGPMIATDLTNSAIVYNLSSWSGSSFSHSELAKIEIYHSNYPGRRIELDWTLEELNCGIRFEGVASQAAVVIPMNTQ